jgi:hypothetical protein
MKTDAAERKKQAVPAIEKRKQLPVAARAITNQTPGT